MSETTNLKLFKHDNPATNENQFDIQEALNDNWDKIDNFAGKVNDKVIEIEDNIEEQATNIKNLQKNDAQQDKSIEALQKENTELKEECSRLRQDLNAFPSGQAEGEYITLKDSADSRFNMFRVGGNSKQETRSGKNVLNIHSEDIYVPTTTNIEKNGNNITVNSNDAAATSFVSIPLKVKPNTNYTFSGIARLISNTITESINSYIRVRSGSASGDWVSTTFANISKNSTDEQKLSFTFNSGDYTELWLWLYIKVGVVTGAISVEFSNLQVEEGSEVTEYEEYGAMPSPEYPSEIQNIEGNINVTVCNKNLCYKSIIKDNDNVNFYFNAKSIAKEVAISFIADKSLKGNSIYCKADGVSIGRILAQVTANANSKANAQIIFTDEEYEKVKNADEVYFQLYKAGANFETINEPMIENSPTATDYVEHQEQNFLFPLAEGQRLMLGDYLAQDGIHHVRKQVELDGTENWVKYNDYNNSFRCSLPIGAYNGICSHYKTTTSLSQINKDNSMYCAKSNYLYISDLRFTNVEDFKEYLLEQKQKGTSVVIEYLINNNKEEIEPYTPEQQEAYEQIVQTAKSYKNVTNIYSPDPVSPVFSINYRKDIEIMLEQVQAQTNAINELLSTTKTSATLLDNLQNDLESEVM